MSNKTLKLALRRFVIVFLISLVAVFTLSELAFQLIRDESDRAPELVTLVIPRGTAERIARGEAEPSIPSSMTFVIGDTLMVHNDDSVDHELGPLFIPAMASASLVMSTANDFDYSCSFTPTQFLGLTVRESTDANMRFIAISYVTPATAIFIFLYSLVIWPLKTE